MKTILVAGGTGTTGKLIAKQLADADYMPISMVRDSEDANSVTVGEARKGDLEDLDASVFQGVDGAIFAAGSGGDTGTDKTISVDQEGAKSFVDLAKSAGVQHLVMLSAKGADAPDDNDEDIQPYMHAKRNADEHLQAAGITYTIVRPVKLSNDSGTGNVHLSTSVPFEGEVPRADVASVLVEALRSDAAKNVVVELRSGETPVSSAYKSVVSRPVETQKGA